MGKNKRPPFIAINVYHSMTLRNADPDLNEISGGSTDLGKNSTDRRISIPLFTPLKKMTASRMIVQIHDALNNQLLHLTTIFELGTNDHK